MEIYLLLQPIRRVMEKSLASLYLNGDDDSYTLMADEVVIRMKDCFERELASHMGEFQEHGSSTQSKR